MGGDVADGYLLSEGDLKLLQTMLKRERARPAQGVRSRHWYEPDGGSPEVYLARTPTEGIPDLEFQTGSEFNDAPGSADCQIYQVADRENAPEILPVTGLTCKVFNFSTDPVPGSAWILIARDKFGTWFVTGLIGSADTGTGTGPATNNVLDLTHQFCNEAGVMETVTYRITFPAGTTVEVV